MNQGKEYKKGAILGAVAALICAGLEIYILADVGKNMEKTYKTYYIILTCFTVLTAVLALAKLNRLSVIGITGAYVCMAIILLRDIKYTNEYFKLIFDSKYKFKVSQRIYYFCGAFDPYFVTLTAVLCLVLFILCFTTPNRSGMATCVTVFGLICGVILIVAQVCYIIETSEYAKGIDDYWINNIRNIVRDFAEIFMVAGISKSVSADDVKMFGQSSAINSGMYGIPYAERPRQNSQFGFGSGMNVYNTPQNPNYDQQGSFNQRNMFGQPGMNYDQPQNMGRFGQPQMGGYGQNMFGQPGMNYNQPQNMGGFGQPQVGSYGQPQMGSFNQQPMGGYNQNMNGYGQGNAGNYGQQNNPVGQGQNGSGVQSQNTMAGQNQMNGQSAAGGREFSKPEGPEMSENPMADLPAGLQENSLFEKPDNGVSFEQPQSFTSTDI